MQEAPQDALPAATPPGDLSTMCGQYGSPMHEEHAHERCPACGWRDSCCDGSV